MPVTITSQDVIKRPWTGLGIGWDAETKDSDPIKLTDDQWQTLFRRMDYMHPAWIRSMIDISWFCPDGRVGSYNFASPTMQAWYPILDYTKSHHIPIMLGTWGDQPWGFHSQGYATALTDLLQYLIHERGYTNIHFFNGPNEPDSRLPDFETWWNGASYFQSMLAQRGLKDQVSLVGPDTSWTNGWITESDLPSKASSILGAYEWHYYERTCCNIRDGQVENYLRPIVERLAGPEQPDAKTKQVLLGEMGWGYQMGPGDNQFQVKGYQYGVEMADFALQATRAGISGAAAWNLDDAMHNKTWGMWNITDEPDIRPWFYSWALLSRYFPSGATLYRPNSPAPTLRLIAAQVHSPQQTGWSIALVNRGDATANVKLKLPDASGQQLFSSYVYSDKFRPSNLYGLPLPAARTPLQAGNSVDVQVPANSLLVVSNLDQDWTGE
ncbi:MAG TPA: hypothetical protein VFN23_04710 [Ktedonobacteraceae bacterium]|nr:hypothetical protein [Ktedonobacteraceae bacterium]